MSNDDYSSWTLLDSINASKNLGELFHKYLDDTINTNNLKAGNINPDYDPFKKGHRIQDTVTRKSVFDELKETIKKEMEKEQGQKDTEKKPLVEPSEGITVRKILNGYLLEVDYQEVFVTNKNDIIKYLK